MPSPSSSPASPSIGATAEAPTWPERFRPGLHRYLRVLGCDPTEADDLCHEVIVRALRAGFAPASDPAGWAYLTQAARWELGRARRSAGRSLEVGWTEAVDDAYGRHAARDGGEQWLDALRACVETLPPRTRRAVHLHYVEQRSRREIAAALGMKENGVKTLMQRARKALARCIEQRLGAAGPTPIRARGDRT